MVHLSVSTSFSKCIQDSFGIMRLAHTSVFVFASNPIVCCAFRGTKMYTIMSKKYLQSFATNITQTRSFTLRNIHSFCRKQYGMLLSAICIFTALAHTHACNCIYTIRISMCCEYPPHICGHYSETSHRTRIYYRTNTTKCHSEWIIHIWSQAQERACRHVVWCCLQWNRYLAKRLAE